MQNIVIVGAGPIGLYIAIRLQKIIKEYNLDVKVTLLDPRAGSYDRPGQVANIVLGLLSKGIEAELNIPSSTDIGNAMPIKDLETALFKVAKTNGIEVVKGSFEDFVGNKIKIKDDGTIPCDLAFDCSGANRVLVKKINEKNPNKKPFSVAVVADNPLKTHFLADLKMSATEAHLSSAIQDKYRDPVKQVLALEVLRNQFGWPEFSEPEFTSLEHTKKKKSEEKEDTINKYSYFEIPPDLAKAEKSVQIEWIKALLKLRSEHDAKFEIIEGKGKFGAFIVNPHKVVEPYAEGNADAPMVIPCGDAQIEPDYRKGIGIKSGIERANALFAAMKIDKSNQISIDKGLYKDRVSLPIFKHERELALAYRQKRESELDVLKAKNNLYAKALLACKNEKESKIILAGLAKINNRIGILTFKKQKSLVAKEYFLFALTIYQTNFPNMYLDKVTQILSNLAIINLKNKSYEDVIKYADQALAIIPLKMNDREKLILKIKFNKCMALINQLNDKLKNNSPDVVKVEFEQIKVLFEEVRKNPDIQVSSLNVLVTSFNILENKMKKEDAPSMAPKPPG